LQSGKTDVVINHYLAAAQKSNTTNRNWENRKGNRKIEFIDIGLYDLNGNQRSEFFMGDDIIVKLKVRFNETISHADIGINIKNNYDEIFTHIANFDDEFKISGKLNEVVEYDVKLSNLFFTPDTYNLDVAIVSGSDCFDNIPNCMDFDLIESEKVKRGSFPNHVKIYTPSKWKKV